MTTTQVVLANVTTASMAGAVSKELQAQKWQLNLQGSKNVVRITLPGCWVFILQWLRVESEESFALISLESAKDNAQLT